MSSHHLYDDYVKAVENLFKHLSCNLPILWSLTAPHGTTQGAAVYQTTMVGMEGHIMWKSTHSTPQVYGLTVSARPRLLTSTCPKGGRQRRSGVHYVMAQPCSAKPSGTMRAPHHRRTTATWIPCTAPCAGCPSSLAPDPSRARPPPRSLGGHTRLGHTSTPRPSAHPAHTLTGEAQAGLGTISSMLTPQLMACAAHLAPQR